MPTGLQTGHSTAFQDAIKNGLQSCVVPSLLTSTTALGTLPAGYFFSTIKNRASLYDPSAELKVSMGIERIQIRQGYEIAGEYGPQNERVWGLKEDNRIRFIGDWSFETGTRDYHARSTGTSSVPCYLEITFYGTGINLLTQQDIARAGLKYAVDSASYSADIWTTATLNTTTRDRNYALNQTLKIASGLSLGMHTVIIRSENTHEIWGVEILNQQTSNLVVTPGTAYISGLKTTYAGGTLAYNSGVSGTKGGRQLVYLKSDRTIGSAFQATDPNTRYIGSADHTYEEISRTYGIREFGANRADDFSTLSSTSSNRAFTLNDGLTTLQCVNGVITIGGGLAPEGLSLNASGIITFTFVGTGLDIVYYKANSAATMDTHTVTIDGTAIGNITDPGSTFSSATVLRLASGLPYGTHQVQIARTTTASLGCWITAFRTYQPKKPTLPDGAIELAEYCVLANFSGTTSTGVNSISTGLLRKAALREPVYYGTGWSLTQSQSATLNLNSVAGYTVDTAVANDYLEYTFWGTGIEARFYQATVASYTDFTIDGYSNFSTMPNGNGGTGITTAFGGGTSGISVTTTNGSANVTTASTAAILAGATVTGTGIPAGAYVVSITNATTFVISAASTASGTVTATFNNLTWSATTGRLAGDSGTANYRGCYLRFTNLALGLHTIRITRKTAHSFSIESLDVISPIYMPVSEGTYRTLATLTVGNNSLSDIRNFDFLNKKQSIVTQQRTGKLINSWFVQSPAATMQTITSTVPIVITGLSITLVPSSANSRFMIYAVVNGSLTYVCSSLIYRNGSPILSHGNNSSVTGANATTYFADSITSNIRTHTLNYTDAPGTTSSITYDIRHVSVWTGTASTTYVNNRSSNDMACPCTLMIMEFES